MKRKTPSENRRRQRKKPPIQVEVEREKPTDDSSGFYFEDIGCGELDIKPIETSKDKIEQPELARDERMIIPPLGSSMIICGKSGSGKSTLLANLLKDERFYGKSKEKPHGWFDKIFLFSPTASGDDIQKSLEIPKAHVYTDFEEAPELLDVIQKAQQKKLEGGGKAHLAEQVLVIFDDFIGETSFMNTAEFKRMFYMVRHINATTACCTQHFTKIPKIARLQSSFVFFFAGSANEVEIIVDEYGPPQYTKKEFREIINQGTQGRFNFLTICMKVGWEYRFRRNLSEFIHLTRLEGQKDASREKKPEPAKEEKQSTFSDADYKTKKNLETSIEYFRARHAGRTNESARAFGEWARKGPRRRTLG